MLIEMPLTSADIVLVIGGAGFLGQHIIKHLLSDTVVQEIRVLDKKSCTCGQITAGNVTLVIVLNKFSVCWCVWMVFGKYK